MTEGTQVEDQLRAAFAARAERTTVTDRTWHDRSGDTELEVERHGRRRIPPLLAAAAIVAIVAGGVGLIIGIDDSDTKVTTATAPSTSTPPDSPHENERIAPPTTMQFGAATDFFQPEPQGASTAPAVDSARTSVACRRWHVAAGAVICDRFVGRVVVAVGHNVHVHTLYGVNATDDGYTLNTPISSANAGRVNGRPAVVTTDATGSTRVAFEIDAETRVVVEGTGTVDELQRIAETVNATRLDRPAVALVAAEHRPSIGKAHVQYPTVWVAVGVDTAAKPCVTIVPSTAVCRVIDDKAVGGVADSMMVVGWARPDVARVEVRTTISTDLQETVDAVLLDPIDLGGTRVFYADADVDPYVRITATAYDRNGTPIAAPVDIQEPCQTCE